METKIIKNESDVFALRGPWDELVGVSGAMDPFMTFEWASSWMKVMAVSSPLVRHDWHLITVFHQGALVGLMPMFETKIGFLKIPFVKLLRPVGADPNLTEIKAPLVHPDHEVEAMDMICQAMRAYQRRYHLLKWPDMPLVTRQSSEPNWSTSLSVIECYHLPLGTSWELFKARRKTNIKESIRKCYNSPRSDGVDLQFSFITDKEQIISLMSDFYHLHAMRAGLTRGPIHPNNFRTLRHRQFLEMVINNSCVLKPVLLVLKHGEQVVAVRLAFQGLDYLYLYFSGYQPSYGKYSVATRIVVEAIKTAIERGISTLHLSTGRDESKLRWSPELVVLRSHIQYRRLGILFKVKNQFLGPESRRPVAKPGQD